MKTVLLSAQCVKVISPSVDTGTSGETIRKSYAYMVYHRTQFEDVVVFSAFLKQPCYFEVSISCDYASNVGLEGIVL